MDLSHILAMSGYGSYVWTAFFVTVTTLVFFYRLCRSRLKKALDTHQKLTEKQP